MFKFVATENCPICRRHVLTYRDAHGHLVFNHNGYDYVKRNSLIRDCMALKKAKEMQK